MNPYEILGIVPQTILPGDWDKVVKSAYRKLSAKHHPDKEGGNRETFEQVKLAYDILSDKDRRERYDKLGRTDVSRVTPQRVKLFIKETMGQTIHAERPDGTSDDVEVVNVRDKIMLGIKGARVELERRKKTAQRKLDRANKLLKRFKPKGDYDPVGEVLKDQVEKLEKDVREQEDALELSEEVERVMATYIYDNAGPWAEGQFTQGPTTRRGGSVVVGSPSITRPTLFRDDRYG